MRKMEKHLTLLRPNKLISSRFVNNKVYTILIKSGNPYYQFGSGILPKFKMSKVNMDNINKNGDYLWSGEDNFKYCYKPLKIKI